MVDSEKDVNKFVKLLEERKKVRKSVLKVNMGDREERIDVFWCFLKFSERPAELVELYDEKDMKKKVGLIRSYYKDFTWRMVEKAQATGQVPSENTFTKEIWDKYWEDMPTEMERLAAEISGLSSRMKDTGF